MGIAQTARARKRMKNPAQTVLRVLILEDSELDSVLLTDALQSIGFQFEWTRVTNESDYRLNLAGSPDIVFADCNVPSFSTAHALALTRQLHPDIPFLVVSGVMDDDIAARYLKAGATDCVSKNHPGRFEFVVRRALREVQERIAFRKLKQDFNRLEKMESITQLDERIINDFNNALTIIQGHASLLSNTDTLEKPVQESVRQISAAAERVSALAKHLFVFGKR